MTQHRRTGAADTRQKASKAVTDHRNSAQRLYDAIMQTPSAQVDAYNAGRDHAFSTDGPAEDRWYADDSAVGEAFWRGVQDGTASVQRLVDALGNEECTRRDGRAYRFGFISLWLMRCAVSGWAACPSIDTAARNSSWK